MFEVKSLSMKLITASCARYERLGMEAQESRTDILGAEYTSTFGARILAFSY